MLEKYYELLKSCELLPLNMHSFLIALNNNRDIYFFNKKTKTFKKSALGMMDRVYDIHKHIIDNDYYTGDQLEEYELTELID